MATDKLTYPGSRTSFGYQPHRSAHGPPSTDYPGIHSEQNKPVTPPLEKHTGEYPTRPGYNPLPPPSEQGKPGASAPEEHTNGYPSGSGYKPLPHTSTQGRPDVPPSEEHIGGYPTSPGYKPPPYQPPCGGDTYPASSASGMYSANDGGEDPEVKGFDFSEESIRRGFIRKVYSILMLQLALTLAIICWFMYHKPTQKYVQYNVPLLLSCFPVLLIIIIPMIFFERLRRKPPMNYIFLFIFTLAQAYCLAVITTVYDSEVALMAVSLTAAICLGLTLFAFQTKWDFTVCGGVLFVALLILLMFGMVMLFVRTKVMSMVYSCLGAFIFSVHLVYDTQRMIGGDHKYSISPEEYIFAALSLYLDIISILIYILSASRK